MANFRVIIFIFLLVFFNGLLLVLNFPISPLPPKKELFSAQFTSLKVGHIQSLLQSMNSGLVVLQVAETGVG